MDDGADQRRPLLGRGRLTGPLMRIAGNMAITEFSITLGHTGRDGAVAIAAVLAATDRLRGLEADAPLRRYGSWVFLTSAGVAAVVAAFIAGPSAGTLTIAAVVLAACAGWLAPDLRAATRLLAAPRLSGPV